MEEENETSSMEVLSLEPVSIPSACARPRAHSAHSFDVFGALTGDSWAVLMPRLLLPFSFGSLLMTRVGCALPSLHIEPLFFSIKDWADGST